MTTASSMGDPASQSQESAKVPADVRGEAQQVARRTVLEGIRGKVFLDRYARKGEDGTPLEQYPEQMWRRVAAGIAAVEPTPEKQAEWTEKFDGLLRDFKFVPGGRILSGAGTGHQVTYYNCFSGDTLVHTSEGIMRIGALRGTHDVLSQDGVYRPATFKSYGIQDLWDIVLENGTVIRATAGHEWVVKAPHGKRVRVTTRELAGRSIPVNPRPKPEIDEDFHDGVRHGIIFGDGSTQYGKAHVDLFGEKMGLATRFEGDYPTHVVGTTAAVAEHARVSNLPTSYKALPSVDASPSYWRGFVVGLIATDGHVDNRGSVAIYGSNADQLHAISYGMAQAGFVPSSIRMTREFSPYSGERRPVYRLAIYRSSIVAEDIIKESHALNWAGAPFPIPALIKVESARPLGQAEEVFCCEEPETHTFTVGHGYLTGNCYVVGLGEDPLDPDAPRYPRLDPTEARPAFFNALGQMTDIMSRSGGVGINLSALPPRGTPSAAPGRAANAGATVRPTVALSLAHPDVARLLDEKDGPNLSHVDVAVIVPHEFDQALRNDEDWTPRWEDRAGETAPARDLWARVTSDEGRKVGILRPEAEVLRIDDSRDAIVSGAAEAATRLYQGQATVVDFSRLRPRGAYIKTVNGTSSGPVAWMYLVDAVARLDDGASPAEKGVIWFGEIASTITGKTIQQGGSRRGALMLMLDDDHPDVEEFIAAKRIGPDGRPVMIEHANMSLCVSDRFMEAVKADLPWDLVWQGRVVRTIRARDMWDRICTAAWTTAEPGVVFMERYQDRSNTYYFENIRCVNPCFPADARLYTGSGIYTFGELAALGSAVPVVAPDGSVKQATHVFQTGHREVFRLTTNEGYTVRLTADHRVLTPAGLVEARDLAPGDEVLLLDAPGAFGPVGTARDGERLARRYAGDRDTDLRDLWRSTREMRAAFLARLFEEPETTHDGSLHHRADGDHEALLLIQQMLLTLGVRSDIAQVGAVRSLTVPPADRDMLIRAAGGLRIASGASLPASREAEPLVDGLRREHAFAATVERLTSEGYEDVYCLTEPDEALIVVDGVAATQCGEQGLPPGGVCNLGALNLERYVDGEGKLLEDDLARDAAYATRFLDDVIDATPYFSELHVQMQREGTRRTGLGTMGLADALIRMGVGYGSPASLETIDRIYRIVRDASYRESVELAREKGPFGRFDREEYLRGWFIGRLPADIQEGIREHGIRNGVLLTQAPTGCLIPGMMVLTDHGYLPIETLGDATGEQWQDITLHVASEGGVREADQFFINGEAHTTRVVTKRGYEIQGTDHHRIRVWRDGVMEWVPLDQVTPGMTVPIQAPTLIGEARTVLLSQPERCQVHGTPVSLPHSLSAQLAYVIGYFMGDGSLKTRTLRFASSSKADGEQICAFLRDLFGREPIVYADPRAKALTSIELNGQDVVAFWRANDFAKRTPSALHTGKGYAPHVPLAILQSNDAAVYGGFLAGLFDADASLDREYVISWNTNEKKFHDQVKTMLLALGVFTHTYRVASEWGKTPLYRLRPCHARASSLLNRALPMLARIVPQESDARRLTLGDTIPVTRTQGRELVLAGRTSRDKQAAYAATHLGYMTRDRVARLVAAYHDTLDTGCTSLFVDAIDEPIFFDRVTAVEDGGIQPTFDLSVPGTHAYVANGFISHNTTSLLAGVSSGIEPVFDFAMKRVDRTGEHIMYHPLYQQWRDDHPGEERPDFFVGAKDLTPEEHIVVQAKVQEYTDSSISKTANVPNDFTVDNIKDLYMQAYDLGCKGVTCYRDGSRDAVLTSVTEKPKETAPAPTPALAQTADDGAAGPATLPSLESIEAVLPAVETDIVAPLASPAVAPVAPVAPGTSAPEPVRTPAAPAASATPVTTAAQASSAAIERGVATPGGIAAPGMPTWVLDGRLKRRPNEMPGFTQNVTAPEGKVNITINSDADGPLELFINVGRAGTDIAALAEALGRLISLQLRLPSTMSQEERLRQVANQLRGIGGSRSIGFGKHRVLSLPDAVAQAIYRHLEEHPAPPPAHQPVVPVAQLALLDADDTPYSGSGAGPGYSGSNAESGGSSPTLVAIPATLGSADPVVGAIATPVTSPAVATAAASMPQGELAAQATALAGSGVAASNVAGLTNGNSNGGSGHGHGNGHTVKAVEPAQTLVATATLTGNLCPQCGSSGAYVFEEGCKKCHYCGYSEC